MRRVPAGVTPFTDARVAIMDYIMETHRHVLPLYQLEKAHGFSPDHAAPEAEAFAIERLAAGASNDVQRLPEIPVGGRAGIRPVGAVGTGPDGRVEVVSKGRVLLTDSLHCRSNRARHTDSRSLRVRSRRAGPAAQPQGRRQLGCQRLDLLIRTTRALSVVQPFGVGELLVRPCRVVRISQRAGLDVRLVIRKAA